MSKPLDKGSAVFMTILICAFIAIFIHIFSRQAGVEQGEINVLTGKQHVHLVVNSDSTREWIWKSETSK